MAKLNCSDEAIESLRLAVLKKHKKLYGVLKQEVDTALIEHAKKIIDEIEGKIPEYYKKCLNESLTDKYNKNKAFIIESSEDLEKIGSGIKIENNKKSKNKMMIIERNFI